MPAYFHQWLDRVPDLLGLSRSDPVHFPFLLESTATGALGSHSLLLHAAGPALVAQPGGAVSGPGEGDRFFDRLDSWFRQESESDCHGPGSRPDGLPFAGGWFIYLGYEMAAEIEPTLKMPPAVTGLPDAVAQRCPGAVIVFHRDGRHGGDRAVVVAETAGVLRHLLERVRTVAASEDLSSPQTDPGLECVLEEDPVRFKTSVRRIHQYLQAGDTFQVNVSRPWRGSFRHAPDPYRLYESLRRASPAPFAGLMRWENRFLLSSSPERLVQVRGRMVQTRPIAGTRPRGRDSEHDRALSAELISNLKERAEHVMLIDLERNDLGRVCQPGTVEVNELMVVETYAQVHHIVSNVRGRLVAGATPVDAMKAVFPGGTITGCPKVRCMEIIAELEGEGRGFYTGSMGYLGRDGSTDLNILIRSMLVDGRQFVFRTGAGIVSDSDAELEVLETADKARGMLLALESHGKEKIYA
ncbi:aminodeoxychorismate synthase component I [Pseudomonadota bacterium]